MSSMQRATRENRIPPLASTVQRIQIIALVGCFIRFFIHIQHALKTTENNELNISNQSSHPNG